MEDLTKVERLEKYHEERERKEQLEHRDVLLAIGAILKNPEGVKFFSYLFKHFDVACVPDRDIKGDDLHEYLGFLRAGNSIYKLTSEADSEKSASILAKLERNRYDEIYEQHRIENGNY